MKTKVVYLGDLRSTLSHLGYSATLFYIHGVYSVGDIVMLVSGSHGWCCSNGNRFQWVISHTVQSTVQHRFIDNKYIGLDKKDKGCDRNELTTSH